MVKSRFTILLVAQHTLVLLVCLLWQLSLYAQHTKNGLTVASILQSNMVVQQSKPFTLWGTAAPLSKIIITASWKQKRTVQADNNGKWKMVIPVPDAKPGDYTVHQLSVESGKQRILLSNLLIGDVWFCSGQSNMDMSMQPVPPWHEGVKDNVREIAGASHPFLRLFKVKKETSVTLRDTVSGSWKECSPETVADFSGVAYYFGKRLQQQLNIPVGLLQSAYGSAACQAFIKKEVLEADTVLKKRYLDPYYANPEEKIPVLRPMLIYNAMIYPLINFSIKGFLWYQGESNAGEIKLYPHLNAAMIQNWRADFQQGELPFYFVQMTPYNWKKTNPAENNYARFREAQQLITALVPNIGIVCSMDAGEPNNIHPVNKKPVGERLAALALHQTYGLKQINYSGPQFSRMLVQGEKAVLEFLHADGLTTADAKAPQHFFVAGSDKKFYPAVASIQNNRIVLVCTQVQQPVAVRYAFTNDCVTNLQNKDGWPAFPFRTDDWNDEQIMIGSIEKQKGQQ